MKNESYLDDAALRLSNMPVGRHLTYDQLRASMTSEGTTQNETFNRGSNAVSQLYHLVVVGAPACEAALVYIDGKYSYLVHQPGESFWERFKEGNLALSHKAFIYQQAELSENQVRDE